MNIEGNVQEKETKIYTGKVIWFKRRGIGFLEWYKEGVQQKDMFVHYSGITSEGFKMLKEGQMVEFEVGSNFRGQPIAVNVHILPTMA